MSPDRRQPGSAWFVLAYLLAIGVGIVGLFAEPSVSVRSALDAAGLGWAIVVWSVGFLSVGIACTVARWRTWYCAEVWAVYALGGLFWLWSAMVAVAGSGTAWQAGFGFGCSGAFLFGWAGYRRYRLARNARSQDALRQVVGESVGEAIRGEARHA